MNILIIGAGGIGSYIAEHIFENIEKAQLCANVTIADSDIVEADQIDYQNFTLNDVGKSKSKVIGKRYNFNVIEKRINKPSQLKDFNMILLCVDNDKTREWVIKYCHKNKVEFIDLRATGRRIFAMPKTTLKDNLRFVDDDGKEYGCQDKADLDKGFVQMGNQVIAIWGCQMLLNYSRGHTNSKISMTL